jgi:conjugal transfer pilus assembly protein TraV
VLRLWIKPWEDADRDLNGESLVYVQVDNGRWLVDHVQRQAREPYAPIRPTRLPTSAARGPLPDARESDYRPASQPGTSTADDGAAVSQALRALQGRPVTAPGN